MQPLEAYYTLAAIAVLSAVLLVSKRLRRAKMGHTQTPAVSISSVWMTLGFILWFILWFLHHYSPHSWGLFYMSDCLFFLAAMIPLTAWATSDSTCDD